jgi:hypothetical protein
MSDPFASLNKNGARHALRTWAYRRRYSWARKTTLALRRSPEAPVTAPFVLYGVTEVT